MRLRTVVAATMLLLAACANANPDGLPAFYQLQFELESFYARRAQEQGASCNLPRMAITRAQVVEETNERYVLNVTYFWRDDAYGPDFDDDDDFFLTPSPASFCQGWSQREFVVAKRTGGGYSVTSMSGPQRDW